MKEKIIKTYKRINNFLAGMSQDHVSEYCAQCSYYTILSFIPFIILLITLIQYTKIDQQTLFDVLSKIIPSSMNEFVLGIVQEVYSKSIGTISISIIFTLWSAGRGLYALTKGMQEVYKVEGEKQENYFILRLKAVVQTIVFILLITVGLAFLVFGNTLISLIQEYFGVFEWFTGASALITELGFIFITFIIFLLIYKFMPNHKVTLKSQLIGALFAAVALNAVSFVFSVYLDLFKGFSITYGSLTTLILIMMWTYACFYTMFLGAEFNKEIEKIKKN